MSGKPHHRIPNKTCFCRFCHEKFLAVNPKAAVCGKAKCLREQQNEKIKGKHDKQPPVDRNTEKDY